MYSSYSQSLGDGNYKFDACEARVHIKGSGGSVVMEVLVGLPAGVLVAWIGDTRCGMGEWYRDIVSWIGDMGYGMGEGYRDISVYSYGCTCE